MLLFYMVSTHIVAEYAGPWNLLGTLSSTLWAIFAARAVLFITSLS